MRIRVSRLACAALLAALAAGPAYANHDRGNGKSRDHKGAPAPIAGAGLPFLIAAGALAAFRRRRRSN